jgi:hypothetical protein
MCALETERLLVQLRDRLIRTKAREPGEICSIQPAIFVARLFPRRFSGRRQPARDRARHARSRQRSNFLAVMLCLLIVKAVRAHVQNGQIVLDEPTDLPEGVAVEVLIPDRAALTDQDRADIEAECEASAGEFDRGEYEDARALAARLVARS